MPVKVTLEPIAPEVGDTEVRVGVGRTVNVTPLLAFELTVTTTLPVVAPAGTTTLIKLDVHWENVVTVVPLNLTVLVPCVLPNPLPLMEMVAPTAPDVGDKLLMEGPAACAGRTANTKNAQSETTHIHGFLFEVFGWFNAFEAFCFMSGTLHTARVLHNA